MRKPTLEEGRALFNVLTDVQVEAAIARDGSSPADGRAFSPPLAELRHLIDHEDRVADFEDHLLVVARMAWRDVRTRCHLGWWKPRADYPLRQRLDQWSWLADLPRDRGPSWYRPFFIVTGIRWDPIHRDPPTEIWLEEGEVARRTMAGTGVRDAVREAIGARHGIVAPSFVMRLASDHEHDDEEA
jgi:hypothetical protein